MNRLRTWLFLHRLDRNRERAWVWMAWHLPRQLAYWASVRVSADASVLCYPDRTPSEISSIDVLGAWREAEAVTKSDRLNRRR